MDQPSEADQIRLLSYQTIKQVTPYLISAKCGSAFGKWVTESLKLGGELSKESIIRTVTSLETHPDLKLTSSRQLPGFLITTTLNLPPGETEVTLQAHYVNPSSSGLQPAKPALTVNIQNKPPTDLPHPTVSAPGRKTFVQKARRGKPLLPRIGEIITV